MTSNSVIVWLGMKVILLVFSYIPLTMLLQALYYGDEQFWYDTTMLMVNATLLDYENRNAKKVVRNFGRSSLSCFVVHEMDIVPQSYDKK